MIVFRVIGLVAFFLLIFSSSAFAGDKMMVCQGLMNCNFEKVSSVHKKCESGNVEYCKKSTDAAIEYTVGSKKKYKRAKKMFEAACSVEIGSACSGLGQLYFEGWGVSKDMKKAHDHFVTGCGFNDTMGCHNAGVSEMLGQVGDVNYSAALSFLSKSCDAGRAESCNNLAKMYHEGLGVENSLNTAKIYARKACDGGDENGCDAIDRMD